MLLRISFVAFYLRAVGRVCLYVISSTSHSQRACTQALEIRHTLHLSSSSHSIIIRTDGVSNECFAIFFEFFTKKNVQTKKVQTLGKRTNRVGVFRKMFHVHFLSLSFLKMNLGRVCRCMLPSPAVAIDFEYVEHLIGVE